MNFLLQLSKYLGAFAAIVLCIGFVTRSDFSLPKSMEEATVTESSLDFGSSDRSISLGERSTSYSTPDRTVSAPDRAESLSERQHTYSESERSSRRTIGGQDIRDWVETNLSQTFLEADKETMSPGVILATGIYFLEVGQGDLSMNAADVASYLAEVRKTASGEAKKHMKYIANSEEWFVGLKIAGFDSDRIAAIFSDYRLGTYDKQMFNRHVEKKIEQEDYAVADEQLVSSPEIRQKDLAEAFNSYADRPEVKKKYGLPTFKAAEPMSTREVSQGRREAESFSPGQTKEYDDPRFFWSVLQEMIALEHGYDTWEDYQAANPQAADKEFQSRSNIMATGGVMKVTRKKGV